MTVRISSYPRGLLQLLGSQNLGQTPQELGDVVAPVIDTFEMFTTQFMDCVNTNGVTIPLAGGFQVVHRVEQDSIYRLHQVVANVAVDAADAAKTLSFAPAVAVGRLGVSAIGILSSLLDTTPGTREWMQASEIGIPLWLPAGTQIGVYTTNVSAAFTAASLAFVHLTVNRFRAGG